MRKMEVLKRLGLFGLLFMIACAIVVAIKVIGNSTYDVPAGGTTSSTQAVAESSSISDSLKVAKADDELEKAEKEYFDNFMKSQKKAYTEFMQNPSRYDGIAKKWVYDISSADYTNLVLAIQHETGNDPSFYVNGDFDQVQQYMAKSILNRLGQPGFGPGYGTAYTVHDLLSNEVQYGQMLTEMWAYDPEDERTMNNLNTVLEGKDNLPLDLYFERCSTIGSSYQEAIEEFKYNYQGCESMEIVYMSPTKEGRYIIFARNPFGAYAS